VTTFDALMPLLIPLTSLIPGVIIFMLPEERRTVRTALNLGAAGVKLGLVAVMVWGVLHGHVYETRLPLLPGFQLVLAADALSVLLVALSSVLWFVTTLYAVAYLEHAPQSRSRFFGFFSLCVTSTIGIALAGNLITFLIFYEMLTLTTYPLVVHRGTPESMRAGKIYLAYTIGGGALFLAATAWLTVLVGPLDFTQGGMLGGYADRYAGQLRVIFFMLIAGLGVKAALVPLHGWLPQAMIAPAPVSALLHAVAVVKAGAFGIVRVVYDVYGIRFAAELGLLQPLALIAAVTIVYGSVMALLQDDLKKRLAFSTVSQVSYIALGAGILGPLATLGGMVHLVHQGLMKITLFFCAGNLAESTGIHSIRRMAGVGRRLPLTMGAFTLAAFGMIGVPPMAGFISKWYIGLGGVAAGESWVIAVLAASTALNAAYFLPILHLVWFKEPEPPEAGERPQRRGGLEVHWMLLLPPVLTALLALTSGLLAGAYLSPLWWTRLIVAREYQL
jgi:multicomponent Na+:H+ antiporter subunit D